jgi:hypothetical protein
MVADEPATGAREVAAPSGAFAVAPLTTPSAPGGRRSTPRTRGQLATYGVGRTCVYPSCETTLSRYNDAPLCWHHGELAQAAERR